MTVIFGKFLSIDDKWKIVKAHYEKAYQMEFRQRPDDRKIEDLWLALEKLHQSFRVDLESRKPKTFK